MNNKIKKLMIGIGAIATIATPMVTLVSCGNAKDSKVIKADAYKDQVISEDFTWPEGVTEIGEDAFWGATLPEGFKIPSTVTKIGNMAFYKATFEGDFEVPSTVLTVGGNIFEKAKFKGSLVFDINNNTIPAGEFKEADFSASDSLFIRGNIRRIEGLAFSKTILPNNFELPNGILEIDDDAFDQAELPNNFDLSLDSISKINVDAFYWCKFRPGNDGSQIKNIFIKMINLHINSQEDLDRIKDNYSNDPWFPAEYWDRMFGTDYFSDHPDYYW